MRGRTKAARIIAGVAAVLVAGTALYFWLAPVAADWAARRVPASWEVALGKSAEPQLAPIGRQCTDTAALAGLRLVLDRLTSAQPPSRYDFRIVALRDPTVNAFAAPGGLIAMNAGLLREVLSPEELAGVVAHEIQHVNGRHSTRAILREAPMRLAIGALVGGTGAETAASAVGTLGAFSYRRDDELEADREGVRLLAASGVDASPMAEFIRRLEQNGPSSSRLTNYLSTHPAPDQRAAKLRRLASLERAPTRPVMDSVTFAAIKSGCGSTSP